MSPSKYEKQYQAESDVEALQRAHEVQSDPKRHARAKKTAKAQLKEQAQKQQRLALVAKGSKVAPHPFNDMVRRSQPR